MVAAAVVAAASAYSAYSSSKASGKAADAQSNAANQANQTQLDIYNQTRQDNMPLLGARNNALSALQQFYGLGGTGIGNQQGGMQVGQQTGYGGPGAQYGDGRSGPAGHGLLQTTAGAQAAAGGMPQAGGQKQSPYDFNSILQGLPGYQFQLQSGSDAIQRNLAARGLLQSGAAGKALTQYGQQVGQDYAQQYVGGLQSLAGLGMQGAQINAQAGQNYANQTGNNLAYGANAQAAGYANQANAWNSGLSGIAQAYGYYQNQQNGGGNGGWTTYSPMSTGSGVSDYPEGYYGGP